jgi:hypothetical protein
MSIYGVGIFMKVEENWININHNMGTNNVNTLCFNSAGQLLAGTISGVFRTNASVISVNNLNQTIPDEFILYQNYPNPFNPVTKISYRLGVASYVTLQVTDVLGKEVESLVNDKQNAGNYEVEFNGTDLPSGIYFYRLDVNGILSGVKRMILLK